MNNLSIANNNWDTSLYEDKHTFVWQYGEDLLKLLNPKPGESILDLGCGTGQLTDKIAQAGAEVWGIDSAPAMIEKVRENYPHIRFDVADATNFQVEQPFDAVFSNAVLHWVKEADSALASIHQALKPGGRFVAEFGGKGNVQAIVTALYSALESIGIPQTQVENPWYYPSISEYTTLLEQQGFDAIYAILFPRPTPLADGEAGIANWIKMFAGSFLAGLSPEQQIKIIPVIEEYLKPTLYQQGIWTADYRRIRIVAVKL
ncbi:class I SAM-dependent methyltransferase [Nostoc sp. C052]|uniref:class I SAM-dependent methyltransferase n=1 Tax=Nostoc sp. C052 TaxID=2576902 RepID=UPI0015C360F4|nr:class I SAM-dependent methyltransferase [Nostoc sp. C052]QLE39454.1 class I SAM-dependent methyltransferase [Nostoc sp. C052]